MVVGIQDGSFDAFSREGVDTLQYTSLCCTCLHEGKLLDLRIVPIRVDGVNVSLSIVNILRNWSPSAVFLGGATFAGFNVVDVDYVYRETGFPVITYMTKLPDMRATQRALRKHFKDWEMRWNRIKAFGVIHEIMFTNLPSGYYEVIGMTPSEAENMIREQIVEGRMPEPLRLANIIAKSTSSVFQGLGETGHGFSG